MTMDIKFEITDWNLIADKGLPNEEEMCYILVVKKAKGGYGYEFGGYKEESQSFYVNWGLGGCVIEADSVVAWAPLFTGKNFLTVVE